MNYDFGSSAKLILARHGETEGNSSIRYHGRTDVPLSAPGRSQMRAVRAALEQMGERGCFERVFTSPLSRAREAARLIAGERADVVELEELTEVDFGLFEGLTAEEIRERYPAEFERWHRARLEQSYAYPGGESRSAFDERVGRGLERLLAMWQPSDGSRSGTALMVAHRGVIRSVVRHLVGVEPVAELGSIQILEFQGEWRIGTLDLTSHLAKL